MTTTLLDRRLTLEVVACRRSSSDEILLDLRNNQWELLMENGIPWWEPPAWVDPERNPIRNTVHHPPSTIHPTSTSP